MIHEGARHNNSAHIVFNDPVVRIEGDLVHDGPEYVRMFFERPVPFEINGLYNGVVAEWPRYKAIQIVKAMAEKLGLTVQ